MRYEPCCKIRAITGGQLSVLYVSSAYASREGDATRYELDPNETLSKPKAASFMNTVTAMGSGSHEE
jgi:hypothetical protein